MKNRNLPINDNWATPESLYKDLNDEFHFDFDPCPLNHDISLWDGLKIDWGKSNFINPPYSRKLKEAFVLKALFESKKNKVCVLLLPVSTSTSLFHDIIKPNAKEIRFLRGRVKFTGMGKNGNNEGKTNGMHDSMLIIFQ
jgi:site-specific DNA-methyltransferase (adenine-specific)